MHYVGISLEEVLGKPMGILILGDLQKKTCTFETRGMVFKRAFIFYMILG